MSPRDQLQTVYRKALDACAPASLVAALVDESTPRDVVAIGKCAGTLFDGVASQIGIRDALVLLPDGYLGPARQCEVLRGGHPEMTAASFAAGRRLLEFVAERSEVLFLVSGGGSACVEAPLQPWFDQVTVAEVNDRLVRAGLPIADINCVRKHLSAIKGGRLASHVARSVTLVLSDVSPGRLADVASGPSLPDVTTSEDAAAILSHLGLQTIAATLRQHDFPDTPERLPGATAALIADNKTLTAAAAKFAREQGLVPIPLERQLECDVESAAAELHARAAMLGRGEVLIAGGEVTVLRRGEGRGGRCMELAVRLAMRQHPAGLEIVFASSDGADGSSGAAGIAARLPAAVDRARMEEALARSASMEIAELIGEPLRIPPTGNNLRDLYLLTHG